MRKVFGILAVAGLVVFGAGAASAQGVDVRIGPSGVRVEQERDYRPRYRERIVERRVVRPVRTRTVCRTVMEERVRRNGVVVRRPVERCRQVVAGRRVYVD
ncbi:hypothetical protein BB934_13155 [Microvirga ossetica]|jgi:hypothetical protein|uniref:UrcA family protein n=1 Tax=Microvirga ossetica TaxID=1882682 RepID=A0A1B2EGR0_9HYPH|nr:hypothetical protein [Microvirga ossetica]ANY79042.1 hypothetical protein BB934_13155 [Microvirga ossetica]